MKTIFNVTIPDNIKGFDFKSLEILVKINLFNSSHIYKIKLNDKTIEDGFHGNYCSHKNQIDVVEFLEKYILSTTFFRNKHDYVNKFLNSKSFDYFLSNLNDIINSELEAKALPKLYKSSVPTNGKVIFNIAIPERFKHLFNHTFYKIIQIDYKFYNNFTNYDNNIGCSFPRRLPDIIRELAVSFNSVNAIDLFFEVGSAMINCPASKNYFVTDNDPVKTLDNLILFGDEINKFFKHSQDQILNMINPPKIKVKGFKDRLEYIYYIPQNCIISYKDSSSHPGYYFVNFGGASNHFSEKIAKEICEWCNVEFIL